MKKYKVACDPQCGFEVTSHDKNEAVNVALKHAVDKHKDLKTNRDEVLGMVEEV